MKIIKTKQLQKGFTLIEVLLVIVLIGILISIGLVTFNAESRFIDTRNDIRKTHIQTLESAITQYKLQEGNYPTGLSRNYQEICDPEATVCTGFFDLKQFLVPTYLQAIPQDPNYDNTTGGAGYSVAVDEATNTVSVRALQAEGDVIININDPLPAEPTTITNTPLAATVPVTPPPPTVTNGLVLHLDAGNPASYPGTGTTWFDLSGNNNNGTLINGVGYNSANGGSLVFDGVNDYVSIPNFSPLASSPAGTISNWSYVRQSKGYHFWGNLIFLVEIQSSQTYRLRFNLNGDWREQYFINFPLNIYHKLDITWDGITTRMYINAQEVLSSTIDSSFSTFSNTTNQTLEISKRDDNYSNVDIAQTFIYNRALTSEEIQQNFNATRGRFGL